MHKFTELNTADKIAVHWFEQNSFALKGKNGKIIFIDPFFPKERPADIYVHRISPLNEEELKPDLVLFTHDHLDHTNVETIKRISSFHPSAKFAGPKESIERITSESGIKNENCITLQAGDIFEIFEIKIHVFYSKPPNGDPKAKIKAPDTTHLGYVLEIDKRKLYFTGDCINTLAEQGDILNEIKKLNPEIAFIVTHPTEGEFPFFEGTVELARKLNLKKIVPAHYSCFVKRNFDPYQWAKLFEKEATEAIIIPHNSHILI